MFSCVPMHHRRVQSHRRQRRQAANFDAIPEVPAHGALVKVAMPSHEWSASSTSAKTTNSSRLERSSLSSGDLEHFGNHAHINDRLKSFNDHSLASMGSLSLPNIWSVSAPTEHEMVGVLEAMGEEVEDKRDIRLGDLVLLQSIKGNVEHYNEYVCVRSLEHLSLLPPDFPSPLIELLPTGVLWAANLVEAVTNFVDRVQGDTFKVLVTGNHSLLLWGLEVLEHAVGAQDARLSVTVATDHDHSIMWFKKNRRLVNVVQWNVDAYEAVLLERTRDACRGRVDLVLGLKPSLKYLKRSIMCLNKGGTLIAASDLSERVQDEVCKFAERHEQRVLFLRKGLPSQWPTLMAIINSSRTCANELRRTSTSSESSCNDQGICLRLEDRDAVQH